MSGTGKLTVGSLFAGIGGFDLGLERTGCFETKWFCEVDPYARRVLAKHWPNVPIYGDIREVVADADGKQQPQEPQGDAREQEQRSALGRREQQPAGFGAGGRNLDGARSEGTGGRAAGRPSPGDAEPPTGRIVVPRVDVLCGGFPCQDISLAGRGAGLAGARSGLWSEYARLVRELRPRYVVVENVPALRKRGLEVVLADLMACGYDAEWDGIPAAAVGAPHQRDRIWIVAYPAGTGREARGGDGLRALARAGQGPAACAAGPGDLAHPDSGSVERRGRRRGAAEAGQLAPARDTLADADCRRRNGRPGDESEAHGRGEPPNNGRPSFGHDWTTEPDVGRVAHGVPARVDRLRSLGNALVPQIAEWLGHRIAEHEGLR